MMSKKRGHSNIALFIPHEGCPNQCSFCNQRAISGAQILPTANDVDAAMKRALESGIASEQTELAFFGGSFTALDREYMLSLLRAAESYCKNGDVKGIRISTRPDCVDASVLQLLASYSVTSIELGAQSMCDEVLRKNNRGHSAEDTRAAAGRILAHGFSLGLQMMTDLPFDSKEGAMKTAEEFIGLSPQTVRIYPTVVLKGTGLADWYRKGEYQPSSLEETISLCAELLLFFHRADIPVIRLGLHAGAAVEEDVLAGGYHPALRELCEGEIYYGLVRDEIRAKGLFGSLAIEVNPWERSKMAGQKRKNLLRLKEQGADCKIYGNAALSKYEVSIYKL